MRKNYSGYITDDKLLEFIESQGVSIPTFANLAMHIVMNQMLNNNESLVIEEQKPVEVKDLTDKELMIEVLDKIGLTKDRFISQGCHLTLAQKDIIVNQFSNRGRRIGIKMIDDILPWQT